MRHVILAPILATFFSMPHLHTFPFTNISSRVVTSDDSIINHTLDGLTYEWPASRFETDVSTDISFAIDNDAQNLYLALNIPNEGIQMKLEKTGMKLFIDLKGKRKEGRGIAFPIKDEAAIAAETHKAAAAAGQEGEKTEEPKKKVDKKTQRSMAALRLNYMNVFGFEGAEAHDQGLRMPNSINIAFAWDTAGVMHVEYIIPLKMIDDPALLKNKEISVGWRVNGIYPTDRFTQTTEHRAHTKPAAGNVATTTGFDPSHKPVTRETIIRENNMWTRYSINF